MKRFFLIFTVFLLLFSLSSLADVEVQYHDSISDLYKSLHEKPAAKEKLKSVGYRTSYTTSNCGWEFAEPVTSYRTKTQRNYNHGGYHHDHYSRSYTTYPKFEKKNKHKKYSSKHKARKHYSKRHSSDYDSYYKGRYSRPNVKSGYKRASKEPYDGHPFKEYGWGQP